LKKIVDSGADVAIVGGGFLGSELACALAHRSKERTQNGKPGGKIIQLMPETGNISKVLPEYLSKWATDRVRDEGAEVLTNVELVGTSIQEGKVNLSYIDPKERKKTSYITVDHVVVAVGIEPNTDLAKSAGLEIDSDQGGFLVNAELQARHNIWVAGDAASFYDIKLGRRRVEHYDHAIVSGKLAGENMTGAHKPYWHQSMFWSDLGPKVGFEAIGLTDSNLQTVAVYAKGKPDDEGQKEDSEGNREQEDVAPAPTANELKHKIPETKGAATTNEKKDDYSKGVVFYLKENKVVGIVLWNVFNRIPIARKIIKDQEVITNFQELAKLFNIHQD
jgi:programmed cell death 8 (apoptosis-inducing factor)